VDVSVRSYQHRGATFSSSAADLTAMSTAMYTTVLERSLRVGDYLFLDSDFADEPTHCVPCPPGLVCKNYI